MVWQYHQNQGIHHKTGIFKRKSDFRDRQEIWWRSWSGHVGSHGSQESWSRRYHLSQKVGGPYPAQICCQIRTVQQKRQKFIQTACSNETLPSIYLPSASFKYHQPIRFSSRPSPLPQNLPHAWINSQQHGYDPTCVDQVHNRQQPACASRVGPFRVEVECDIAAGQLLQRVGVVRRECLRLEVAEFAGLAWVLVSAVIFLNANAGCKRYHVRQDTCI